MRKMTIVEVDDEEEMRKVTIIETMHRDRRRGGGIEDAEGPPKGTHKKDEGLLRLLLHRTPQGTPPTEARYVDAPFIRGSAPTIIGAS